VALDIIRVRRDLFAKSEESKDRFVPKGQTHGSLCKTWEFPEKDLLWGSVGGRRGGISESDDLHGGRPALEELSRSMVHNKTDRGVRRGEKGKGQSVRRRTT